MSNAIPSPRRILFLSLVISLGILGFALPRPTSKAHEPAKGVDKKALREQIVALHVEIDLLEVEQGVDRDAVSDLIREERSILAAIDEYLLNSNEIFASNIDQMAFSGNQEQQRLRNWKAWGGELLLSMNAIELQAAGEDFDKNIGKFTEADFKKYDDKIEELYSDTLPKEQIEQLKALMRIKNKDDFSKARKELSNVFKEKVNKKATERVHQKSAAIQKDFTRRSAEIAGKKLDLTTLERQYHEAR